MVAASSASAWVLGREARKIIVIVLTEKIVLHGLRGDGVQAVLHPAPTSLAMTRETETALERYEGQARRRAEWLAAMDDAILSAFATGRETTLPSRAACDRIFEALNQLVEGDIFSRADRYFGRYLAAMPELAGPDAVVGRAFVRRYRHRLAAGLVAAALEEPACRRVLASDPDYDDGRVEGFSVPLVKGAKGLREMEERIAGKVAEAVKAQPVSEEAVAAPVLVAVVEEIATPVPENIAPKRKRGRPSNEATGKAPALSQVERNRRYRARRVAAAAVTVPRELADRLSAARGARGLTTAELLAEALDALGA